MTNPDGDLAARVAALDARVEELEAVQELLLRLISTTRPVSTLLERYGATETQELALYKVLDDLADRARGPERDRPTLAFFKMRLDEIFPALRQDAEFVKLLIDMLKIERSAYRGLHAYMVEQGWT
jgi:hypothetical protein